MSCSFDPKQIRVALLAGGKSGERSISLASGEGAKEALLEAGFPVTVFDPANKEDLLALIQGDFDVAFLALHGKYGEDGTIQGFLETIGLPYIGPGVWSSATAIDKPKTKLCYERAGIPTPRSMMLDSHHIDIDAIIAEVGSHCVVKAATEGSALGVYLCEGAEEIADAIDKVFQVDTCAFVESFVSGEELPLPYWATRTRALSLLSKLFLPTSSTILSRSTLREGRSISALRPYPKKIPSALWSLRLPPIRRLSAAVFLVVTSLRMAKGIFGFWKRTPFLA